jgi:class 3 adenylate cyclase
VVLGEATHAAIKHQAIARPLDPIEVKGKRDPVACWVLEGLKDDPTTWAKSPRRANAEGVTDTETPASP